MSKGFQAGDPNAGRPKGTQNKEAKIIREKFAQLLENKMPEVEEWLDEIREADPAKGFELMLKMMEYIMPKLKAVETTFNTEEGVSSIKIEVVKSESSPHNSL
jgi:hypothetical protein